MNGVKTYQLVVDFVKKYKVLHLFLWVFIYMINFFEYREELTSTDLIILDNSFLVLNAIVPFYMIAHLILPAYLYKDKFVTYFLIVFVLAFQMSLFYSFFSIFIYFDFTHSLQENVTYINFAYQLQEFLVNFWTYLIPLFCGSAIKVMLDRFRTENVLRKAQEAQLSTELNALKSQVHPHFLFNVMNNIYFQISKNNIKARRLVELTSEMLRYQLYECNEKYVPLKQEIVYFNNYLEVTQMKGIKSERIDFYVGQGVEDEVIAPLVLTLILESAIEYLKCCDKTMHISLIKNDNKLVYEVKTADELIPNDASSYTDTDERMVNLCRRLDLLYPEKYYFEYFNDKYQFYSKLTLLYGTN